MKSKKSFLPLSGREFPRFSAIKTFFRLPQAQVSENFDVALMGIPFDGGTSYRPGARFAPSQVREASSLGRSFHLEQNISIFEKFSCADIGDCSVVPIDLAKSYQKIEKTAGQVLETKKKLFSCGGDHSITLPLLRAFKKKYKKPLRLIHFDAHLDTYPAAWDCEYHHGAFARHAIDEGLIDSKSSLQIGIRGPLAAASDLSFSKKHQLPFWSVHDLRSKNLKDLLKKLKWDDRPTYITFDVDCLDPAFAPGTGTPVVGGLTTYETQRILQTLPIKNLVGGDVVEVCPAYDVSQITSLAAVDVLFQMLCRLD